MWYHFPSSSLPSIYLKNPLKKISLPILKPQKRKYPDNELQGGSEQCTSSGQSLALKAAVSVGVHAQAACACCRVIPAETKTSYGVIIHIISPQSDFINSAKGGKKPPRYKCMRAFKPDLF